MANNKNLVSFADRSTNEVREIARKGGINSGKTRRERKTFKEQFLIMLENDPSLQQQLIQAHIERCKIKYGKGANAGNTAFMNLLEIIGEAPVEEKKINIEHEIEDLTPLANMIGVNITNGNSQDSKD